MLGEPGSRQFGEPVPVSWDDPVPKRQFYRHLESIFDHAFVRDLQAEIEPMSIDPVVFSNLLSALRIRKG